MTTQQSRRSVQEIIRARRQMSRGGDMDFKPKASPANKNSGALVLLKQNQHIKFDRIKSTPLPAPSKPSKAAKPTFSANSRDQDAPQRSLKSKRATHDERAPSSGGNTMDSSSRGGGYGGGGVNNGTAREKEEKMSSRTRLPVHVSAAKPLVEEVNDDDDADGGDYKIRVSKAKDFWKGR